MVVLVLLEVGCSSPEPEPLRMTVVSINTGTADLAGAIDPSENGGWGSEQASYSGTYYGHGLAFVPMVEQVRAYFAELSPDIIGFQELFYSGDCPSIPADAQRGFVCEDWSPGEPTVVERLLGPGYQIACHLGKSDKCIAVKRSFGTLRGCSSNLCLDGLAGGMVDGCGRGSRVGRGVIDLSAGGSVTVVNVHGSSGLSQDDANCRVRQFRQVFVDLGDGEPAANGERNLVFGDMNTDPVRFYGGDVSADELLAWTAPHTPFRFISEVGEDAHPSYGGLVNIDHLLSDFAEGSCYSAGVSPEHPPITQWRHFDHHPLVCSIAAPSP